MYFLGFTPYLAARPVRELEMVVVVVVDVPWGEESASMMLGVGAEDCGGGNCSGGAGGRGIGFGNVPVHSWSRQRRSRSRWSKPKLRWPCQ